MKDPEIEIKLPSKEGIGQSTEEKAAAEDVSREDAEVKKLAAELEDLRQSLVRHQADFSNYRKRAEKENREAGQRATARVIEALIPVVDGFQHALAAQRSQVRTQEREGLFHTKLVGKTDKVVHPSGLIG